MSAVAACERNSPYALQLDSPLCSPGGPPLLVIPFASQPDSLGRQSPLTLLYESQSQPIDDRATPATQPYDLPSPTPPPSLQPFLAQDVEFAVEAASQSLEESFPPSAPYPTSIKKRRHPPISAYDTLFCIKGYWKSAHPVGVQFYSDDEILELCPSAGEVVLSSTHNIKGDMTNFGIVIQQQAQRACTAAATAMLIYDISKAIDVQPLRSTNLGNSRTILHWITEAGLTPRIEIIGKKDLGALDRLIQKSGPAIVTTTNDIGGHVVVVDAICEGSVYLRDPYHGWAISVVYDAFLRGFSEKNDIIQIERV